MSIQITPVDQTLRVTGDIETFLAVPPGASCYWVTLSDGTLLEASSEHGEHRFRVATEGAGHTMIIGARVEHDWRVEWAAVSPYNAAAQANRSIERLPLLDAMMDVATDIDDEIPW